MAKPIFPIRRLRRRIGKIGMPARFCVPGINAWATEKEIRPGRNLPANTTTTPHARGRHPLAHLHPSSFVLHPSARSGFTLLEVLLTLGLSGLLMLIVGLAIDLHLRILRTGRAEVEQAQLARAILRRISQDLHNAVQYNMSARTRWRRVRRAGAAEEVLEVVEVVEEVVEAAEVEEVVVEAVEAAGAAARRPHPPAPLRRRPCPGFMAVKMNCRST